MKTGPPRTKQAPIAGNVVVLQQARPATRPGVIGRLVRRTGGRLPRFRIILFMPRATELLRGYPVQTIVAGGIVQMGISPGTFGSDNSEYFGGKSISLVFKVMDKSAGGL